MLNDKPKPVLEHIEELRKRLIYSLLFVLVFSVVCWIYSDQIIAWLTGPVPFLDVPPIQLHFTDVTEAFGAKFMISIIGGIIMAFPFLIYHMCMYILPGMKKNERKAFFAYLPSMILLFIAGAAFAIWPIVPIARKFFVDYGGQNMVPIITVSSYIDFVTLLTLGMGIVFLLPVVVMFITSIGLVSPYTLAKGRKGVWLGILIAAAAIAPNDGLSMLIIALPVVILFEISLFLSKIKWRRRQKIESEPA